MHVFPPDYRADAVECFIVGYECESTAINRGHALDDLDALRLQDWMTTNAQKCAFARGVRLARARAAMRLREFPPAQPDSH